MVITAIKQKLGPDINGYISNEFYIPAPSLQFDGTEAFLQEYQKRDWAVKFGRAHARITADVLPAFGPAIVAEARRSLAAEPAPIYLPPEARQ